MDRPWIATYRNSQGDTTVGPVVGLTTGPMGEATLVMGGKQPGTCTMEDLISIDPPSVITPFEHEFFGARLAWVRLSDGQVVTPDGFGEGKWILRFGERKEMEALITDATLGGWVALVAERTDVESEPDDPHRYVMFVPVDKIEAVAITQESSLTNARPWPARRLDGSPAPSEG